MRIYSDESVEQYVLRQNEIAKRLLVSLNIVLDSEQATDYQAVTAAAMLVSACISKSTHKDPQKRQALLDNIFEYISMLTEQVSRFAPDVDISQKV